MLSKEMLCYACGIRLRIWAYNSPSVSTAPGPLQPGKPDSPWDQHSLFAEYLQISKWLVSQDVLQRFPCRSLPDQRPQPLPPFPTSLVVRIATLCVFSKPPELVPCRAEISTFPEQQWKQRVGAARAQKKRVRNSRHRSALKSTEYLFCPLTSHLHPPSLYIKRPSGCDGCCFSPISVLFDSVSKEEAIIDGEKRQTSNNERLQKPHDRLHTNHMAPIPLRVKETQAYRLTLLVC